MQPLIGGEHQSRNFNSPLVNLHSCLLLSISPPINPYVVNTKHNLGILTPSPLVLTRVWSPLNCVLIMCVGHQQRIPFTQESKHLIRFYYSMRKNKQRFIDKKIPLINKPTEFTHSAADKSAPSTTITLIPLFISYLQTSVYQLEREELGPSLVHTV